MIKVTYPAATKMSMKEHWKKFLLEDSRGTAIRNCILSKIPNWQKKTDELTATEIAEQIKLIFKFNHLEHHSSSLELHEDPSASVQMKQLHTNISVLAVIQCIAVALNIQLVVS